MATISGSPIQATVMRLIALDACGVPVTGSTGAMIVTDGFVKVDQKTEVEDGEEITVKAATGKLCVSDKGNPSVKWFTLDAEFCDVNPDVVGIISGERVIEDGADNVGGVTTEGEIVARFSMELWQPLAGADCGAGDAQWIYWAFPNVGQATPGDMSIENDALSMSFESTTKAGSTVWGDGPTTTKWLPSGQGMSSDREHRLWAFTSTTPPAVSSGGAATTLAA